MLHIKEKEVIVQPRVNTNNHGFGANTGLNSFRDELISMNNTWRNNPASISNANIDQQTDYTAQVNKVKYQHIKHEQINQNQEVQEADQLQLELSDRAGVGSMYIDESVLQQQEGENDIFDKSLKDQMEADSTKHNANEPTVPYFDIPNQTEAENGKRKRKRRSYNPQDAWPLELLEENQ